MTRMIMLTSCLTSNKNNISLLCLSIRIKEEKKGKPADIMKDVKDEITHILMQEITGSVLSLTFSY